MLEQWSNDITHVVVKVGVLLAGLLFLHLQGGGEFGKVFSHPQVQSGSVGKCFCGVFGMDSSQRQSGTMAR